MKPQTKTAIQAAKQAGAMLRRRYQRLERSRYRFKGKHDIVTKADMEANRIIISKLKKVYPDYDILSEESGLENNPSEYQWVIDPLDGTTNFTLHIPMFCVAIALVYKKQVVASVIYAPILDELYYAEKGQGVYLNRKKITVSSVTKMKQSFILLGRGHARTTYANFIKLQRRLRESVINLRFLGSSSMSLAYIASGRAEGYVQVRPEGSLWDVAAGMLLVQEAGGEFSDSRGKPWWNTSRFGFVATNGMIHRQLISTLKT